MYFLNTSLSFIHSPPPNPPPLPLPNLYIYIGSRSWTRLDKSYQEYGFQNVIQDTRYLSRRPVPSALWELEQHQDASIQWALIE